MRFVVLVREEPIGASDLELQDEGMGVGFGRFVPAGGYGAVAPAFRAWARATRERAPAAIAEAERAIAALPLSLRTSAGERIATEWIHVADFSNEVGADGYELSAAFRDRAVFERMFAAGNASASDTSSTRPPRT